MENKRFWTNDLITALWRFPLPVLCAVAMAFIAWDHRQSSSAQFALGAFVFAAFFWTLAVSLWGEARKSRLVAEAAGLLGILALGYVFEVPSAFQVWFGNSDIEWSGLNISHYLLIGALVLAVTVAPYLMFKASSEAVWQYNHRFVLSCFMAFLGALFAVGGYAAILGTIDILFGVTFSTDTYWKGVAVGFYFLGPWIWLALLPRDFTDTPKTGKAMEFTSYAVALLVTYILIPLATALSLILFVYVVKTLMQGSFTTARLGLTSLDYGVGIILVALLAYPQREESRYVGVFWRAFPFLLVIPSVLLFSSLWIRISEYGWTPDRYLALIAGVWVASIGLFGLSPRLRDDLRLIPGLLGVLLAVTAFGPWGIVDVSASDQYARLEGVLTEKAWLANGRWQKNAPNQPLPYDAPERQTVSGALRVLREVGEVDRLRPWFAGQKDDPFQQPATERYSSLTKKLNVEYTPYNTPQGSIRKSYSSVIPSIFTIPEQSYLAGPFYIEPKPRIIELPLGKITITFKDNMLAIENDQGQRADFDFAKIFKTLPEALEGAPQKPEPLLVDGSGDLPVKLAIIAVNGTLKGEKVELLQWMQYYLMISRKP